MALYQLLSFDGFGYTIPVAWLTAATPEEAERFRAQCGGAFPDTRLREVATTVFDAGKPIKVVAACPRCGREQNGDFCTECHAKLRKEIIPLSPAARN